MNDQQAAIPQGNAAAGEHAAGTAGLAWPSAQSGAADAAQAVQALHEGAPAAWPQARPLRKYNPNPQRETRRVRELMSREGAEALALELNAYWHREGFPRAEHWIESMRVANLKQRGRKVTEHSAMEDKPTTVWVIRSNLVNGLPPR